jgi:hypothetical protein
MSMYKPQQRRVKVDVMAAAGWVSGVLHVPLKTSLVATLNRKSQFLPLTDVITEKGAPPLDFLAVRRDAMLLVVPEDDDLTRHPAGQPAASAHARVRCLLPDATVEGTTAILPGLRVSDVLETSPGFLLLEDCVLATAEARHPAHLPHVIVNTGHVLAVAELGRKKAAIESGDLVGAAPDSR